MIARGDKRISIPHSTDFCSRRSTTFENLTSLIKGFGGAR